MSNKDCELILALDLPDKDAAIEMLGRLEGRLKWVKIGLQMYLAHGSNFVKKISDMGFNIFLDLKLYDIPNTVASAVKSLKNLPIKMLTIHASGGREMMSEALKAAGESNPDLLLLAVTVLTSFDARTLAETGMGLPPERAVENLAKLAVDSGMRGLVCSPLETQLLRRVLPADTVLVTPGVRPIGSDANEQKRITTPRQAAERGSSFIVVGRPILRAEDPARAVEAINAELLER